MSKKKNKPKQWMSTKEYNLFFTDSTQIASSDLNLPLKEVKIHHEKCLQETYIYERAQQKYLKSQESYICSFYLGHYSLDTDFNFFLGKITKDI